MLINFSMFSKRHAVICSVVFLLVLLALASPTQLVAQELKAPSAPPGVTPLFEKTYRGLQHFFVDSTIYQPRFFRFQRKVTLDSTHQFITISETFYDRPYRLPQTMSLDYYIQERIKFDNREKWIQKVLQTHLEHANRGGTGIVLNIPVRIKSKAFKRIFGGDRVGLRVSGNITFELAGRTESREGSAVSSFEERGTFSPKFKQTQQFQVEGRVGDKVTVSVDQNSEATFDFENTLKLHYQGDEDEIVQKIEAGNVNLSLPSTRYVSTSSNHQGLFGLKTEMQVGNFKFTGIASLQRGENEKLSITGASKEQTRRIKDYEYERNRFFFVDDYYLQTYESSIDTQNWILVLDPNRKVLQLDVWKTASLQTPFSETRQGVAALNPDSLLDEYGGDLTDVEEVPGSVEKGRFERLTPGEDYEYDFQRGIFWLKSTPQDNEIIAIAYSYGPNESNLTKVGMLFQDIDSLAANDSSLVIALKLIKPRANNPSYPAWNLTMRNVYNLGASGISPEGFDLRVIYSVTGEDQDVDQKSGKTYNYLLGLDRVNEQDQVVEGGDKIVDLNRRFIFDLGNGYLFFPSLRPFDPPPNSPFFFDEDRHVEIYDITNTTEERARSKFELEITTKAISNKYELGFNVLEGSETVVLNGRKLTRDKDYTIDYFSGTLEIIAPEARRTDAQVEIEYERGQLFQLDKKTLLGGRLEYNFGERKFVGLTAIYYSQSTLDQRIRLGQEPIRNFVWDLNTSFDFRPNFLTSFFDWLPIVETTAESKFKVEAEYAQVNPNPNT
ncbi:MAG: cell surface protein SprA, partial [Calditrichaeota bacterium]